MLAIRQVKMVSGETRWAIKKLLTNDTVRNLFGPGRAYFQTREQAKTVFDEYMAAAESGLI